MIIRRKMLKVIVLIILVLVLISNVTNVEAAAGSLNNSVSGAQNFLQRGNTIGIFNPTGVYNVLNFLYGLALGLGIAFAVVRGMILGVQIIFGSVQERADAKALLYPYLWIVCAIAFGSVVIRAVATAVMKLF